MHIRPYQPADCPQLARLFYDTVHRVNARDYTPIQLNAWANGEVDLDAWDRSFREHCTAVAVAGEEIVGFGDMARDGYLDMPPLPPGLSLPAWAMPWSGSSRWSAGA